MTIVNTHYKYVFIHIPKSAGKSVKQHLLQNTFGFSERKKTQWDSSLQAIGSYAKRLPVANSLSFNPMRFCCIDRRICNFCIEKDIYSSAHLRAEDLRQIFGSNEFEQMYSFAFVRNPWDRCLSAYWYFRRKRLHPLHDLAMRLSLEDFLRFHVGKPMPYVGQQAGWIFNKRGKRLVKFIGKVESIEHDMRTVEKTLGIPSVSFTANINVSRGRNRDYRPYFSDKAAEAVTKLMRRDVGLLGYSFELPAGDSE